MRQNPFCIARSWKVFFFPRDFGLDHRRMGQLWVMKLPNEIGERNGERKTHFLRDFTVFLRSQFRWVTTSSPSWGNFRQFLRKFCSKKSMRKEPVCAVPWKLVLSATKQFKFQLSFEVVLVGSKTQLHNWSWQINDASHRRFQRSAARNFLLVFSNTIYEHERHLYKAPRRLCRLSAPGRLLGNL